MIEIRWAEKRDARRIADLLTREMFPEVGAHLAATMDPDLVLSEIEECITNEGSIVAYDEDRCIGALNLVRHRWWFSVEEYLTDQGFFASKPYRGKVGDRLITYARAHAEAIGLTFYIFRLNPRKATGRVADLERVGYMARL